MRDHFPSEMIAHAVRLYHRFSLSFRKDLIRTARYRQFRDQAFTIWHGSTRRIRGTLAFLTLREYRASFQYIDRTC